MLDIEQIRPELTWRLRHEVLYPDTPINQMAMDEDNYGIHFGAFADNKLIGIVSLFHKGNDYQFRKFAIAASERSKGYGKTMLNYIINYASAEGSKRIWCNARVTAIPFYLKSGFLHTGEFFSKSGFDYEILEKQL